MKTIFIVDDSDMDLMAVTNVLENNYKPIAMSSAAEMFNVTKKIIPDLIIMDLEMPEMDGFEALENLKIDKRLCSVPVVMLTSRKDTESMVQAFELGASDYVVKPFHPRALIRCIELSLQG